jgi:asparagine synthase (glutamine-hydrolysing)
MCGFFGVIENISNCYSLETKLQMSKRISHRGPDAFEYVNEAFGNNNIFFSHFRLAIQGLGESGNQPWLHDNLIILFNGEIYNYQELRADLIKDDIIFSTNCDTELIPWLFLKYSHDFVTKINGIFSIVIFDKYSNELTFYRDFFGVKPMYYLISEDKIFFSSELNSFKDLNLPMNLEAVYSFFLFSYNILDESFFSNIVQLKRSSYLNISFKDHDSYLIKNVNWTPQLNYKNSLDYKDLFSQSIRSQLISDVPIAISLSGGFDSSIILNYVTKNLTNVKAYTVDFGFNSEDVNNSKIVSKFFNVDLEVIDARISNIDYFELLNKIYENLSEPIADSGYIGTYLVSEAARKNGFRVVLSGAGGDEIFGGYTRYVQYQQKSIYYYLNYLSNYFPKKIVNLKLQDPFFHLLTNTSGCYNDIKSLGLNISKLNPLKNNNFTSYPSTIDMMDFDLNNYLVNDILKITDLASMRNGVEFRVPFLDYQLYRNVRDTFREQDYIYQNQTKVKLKFDYIENLPSSLYKMKKTGFGAPIDYIIESCRDKLEEYLNKREAIIKDVFVIGDLSKLSNNFLFHLFIYVKWKESF